MRICHRLRRTLALALRRLPTASLAIFAALGLASLAPTAHAQTLSTSSSQILRASDTFYARFGGGASVSETDATTYAVEMYSLQGELGYQFTQALGLGVGTTYARYPGIATPPGSSSSLGGDRTLTTLHSTLRWTVLPHRRVSPFVNAGPHVTLGGDDVGAGGLFGLGIDVAASRRVSVFAEATAYASLPDAALDGRDDGRATFDGLGFWGLGVRTSFAAAPKRPTVDLIEGPSEVDRGATKTFTAHSSGDATGPVEYLWSFGDGTEERGLVVDHRFGLAGTYPVRVTARNAGGSDTKTLMVTVREPQLAASVSIIEVDQTQTDTVYVGSPVRFRGSVIGTAPVDIAWDFGDGSGPVSGRIEHAYDGEHAIGTVHAWSAQSYVFPRPGIHKVTLSASNEYGSNQRSVSLRVLPDPNRVIAGRPASPCGAVVPDTVFFAFDSAVLSHDGQMTLQRSIPKLKACTGHTIQLDGYTDRVGADSYNRELSARRAMAVRDFYIENGISPERIILRPRGEDRVTCDGGKARCADARRVEAVALMNQPKRRVSRR